MTGVAALGIYLLVCGFIITIQMIRDLQRDLAKVNNTIQATKIMAIQIRNSLEK
jgi:hypothetical protein